MEKGGAIEAGSDIRAPVNQGPSEPGRGSLPASPLLLHPHLHGLLLRRLRLLGSPLAGAFPVHLVPGPLVLPVLPEPADHKRSRSTGDRGKFSYGSESDQTVGLFPPET